MIVAVLSLALALAWAGCACLVPFLRERHREPAQWALVVLVVPLLGWFTLRWGPGAGVLCGALAALVLIRPPLRARPRSWEPRG